MLEGELVRLRPVGPDDVDSYLRWFNDDEVIQFVQARYPLSRTQEQEWVQQHSVNDFQRGLSLAIETLEGVHIGNIGLVATSPEDRRASLGIVIGEKQYWSKGYGADAVRTLLRFAFGEMNLNRVWLDVFGFNERAIACYRKCGFQEEGRRRQHLFKRGRYWDILIMGILREEFEALDSARRSAAG